MPYPSSLPIGHRFGKNFLTAQERLDPFQSKKYKPNDSFFHPKKGNSLAKKRTSIKGPKS
jgi:hypothetical protein